jgi:cyclomaltodextrinase
MIRYRLAGPVFLCWLGLMFTGALAAQVTFSYQAPGAKAVYLAGSFNNWSDSQTRLSDEDGKGVWQTVLDLPVGRYEYKFVVDGSWHHDPANPQTSDDGFGGFNSILNVADPDQAITAGGAQAASPARPQAAVAAAAEPAPAGQVAVTFAYVPGRVVGAVYLAGEFNGWNATGEKMDDPEGDGVYTTTLPLAPGRYPYKFVVDGQWFPDPNNPEGADDGFGGQNSVLTVSPGIEKMSIGLAAAAASGAKDATAAQTATAAQAVQPASGTVEVTFAYAPGRQASGVYLAGSFNDWNPQGRKMEDPDGDGVYTTMLPLAPGRYQYKFVVDGQWSQDPNNPEGADDGFGGQNSVLNVPSGVKKLNAGAGGAGTGDGETGQGDGTDTGTGPMGAVIGMRSVEFLYTPVISGVANVFLAGTFNDWNDSQTSMTDADGDGTYAATLLLAPGTYQYKFVVDGQWRQDPNNPQGAPDGFGGQNSVLEVDASFPGVDIELGDGRIYTDDIEPVFDYSTCNPLSPTEIVITAKAHIDDVEEVALVFQINDQTNLEEVMDPVQGDPAYQYYRAEIALGNPADTLDYVIRYRDAETVVYLGAAGFSEELPDEPFRYRYHLHSPFLTPDWAKDGIIYQIFPERFCNGDKSNDPDFSEPWYAGATSLPANGKTNGEYFHLVEDWYDIAGLKLSPYRTDGKPDYYSFYGGDIAGVREKLDYLNDLGVTVIYFNPLNQGMSNHKYDPVDYLKIDPHFAGEQEFKDFVADAHARGVRIVVDMAFNHTGNWHFAFRDAVEKGSESPYWNWYEFKKWPLPPGRDLPNASDYYDCWWGFGLHPNLNYDLSRPNADENDIENIEDAQPNMPLVEYVLSVADKWLGEYDIDGFRLDVPNEVPFWFWQLFAERVREIKPDAYLVGELWGNAQRWIGPHCFHATMNYKYFRDPVMDFFGKGSINAEVFDQRLAPGMYQYPPQSVQVMMNLIDSHDTIRFLTTTKDVRRLMLAALFEMTYVGMPHIWYGDEIGMEGDKDPDCRRPFDWRYEGDPRKAALRGYYGEITRFRRGNTVLSRGDFVTLVTEGMAYAYARTEADKVAVALFNAGPSAMTLSFGADEIAAWLPEGAANVFKVIIGPESFPQASGGSLAAGQTVDFGAEAVTITLPAMSAALLMN